jgi:hypothetical protein
MAGKIKRTKRRYKSSKINCNLFPTWTTNEEKKEIRIASFESLQG